MDHALAAALPRHPQARRIPPHRHRHILEHRRRPRRPSPRQHPSPPVHRPTALTHLSGKGAHALTTRFLQASS